MTDPTPTRTPTSTACAAVLDAMHRSYDHEATRRLIAAAVLRALVCQLGTRTRGGTIILSGDAVIAIAAELEGQANG
jgi:hypothetical protein